MVRLIGLLVIALLLSACVVTASNPVNGSGKVVSEARQVTGISSGDLNITAGQATQQAITLSSSG
jgi:predicted small secreted protein